MSSIVPLLVSTKEARHKRDSRGSVIDDRLVANTILDQASPECPWIEATVHVILCQQCTCDNYSLRRRKEPTLFCAAHV